MGPGYEAGWNGRPLHKQTHVHQHSKHKHTHTFFKQLHIDQNTYMNYRIRYSTKRFVNVDHALMGVTERKT